MCFFVAHDYISFTHDLLSLASFSLIKMPLSVDADCKHQCCHQHPKRFLQPVTPHSPWISSSSLHFQGQVLCPWWFAFKLHPPPSDCSCDMELSVQSLQHSPALLRMQLLLLCRWSSCTPTPSIIASTCANFAL